MNMCIIIFLVVFCPPSRSTCTLWHHDLTLSFLSIYMVTIPFSVIFVFDQKSTVFQSINLYVFI